MDVDYEEELFAEKLNQVQKNYFGHFLVEVFEKRLPRRLEPFKITEN